MLDRDQLETFATVAEEHSFEDTLRDLMRNSPYLAVSVLVHVLVGLIFYNMDIYDTGPPEELRIEATPEDMAEITQGYVDTIRMRAKGHELHVEQRLEFVAVGGVVISVVFWP